MTSLQGYITADYWDLVKFLGHPNTENDGYKTDIEWEFNIGPETATLYNYKDGKNYLGRDGLHFTKITNWHVGGESIRAVEYFKSKLAQLEIK